MNKIKVKTVNEIARSYTYYLEPKISKLYGMCKNRNVSLDDMKKNVFNYIYDASTYYYDSNGKKVNMKKVEFLDNVNSMKTKYEIYWYCVNSVRRARATLATSSLNKIAK